MLYKKRLLYVKNVPIFDLHIDCHEKMAWSIPRIRWGIMKGINADVWGFKYQKCVEKWHIFSLICPSWELCTFPCLLMGYCSASNSILICMHTYVMVTYRGTKHKFSRDKARWMVSFEAVVMLRNKDIVHTSIAFLFINISHVTHRLSRTNFWLLLTLVNFKATFRDYGWAAELSCLSFGKVTTK